MQIAQLTDFAVVLAARPGLKINSLKELVDYARANPGKLNFGSIGVGSSSHLALEMLKMKVGVNVVHIPFKGQDGVLQAFRGGEIDLVVNTAATSRLLQQQGAALLATFAASRDPIVPDVPSSAEAGVPDVLLPNWQSLLGPAGLPRDIVQRLNRAVVEHLARPEVVAAASKVFTPPKTGTPEEMTALLASTIARYKDVLERAGIKLD